MRSLIIAGFTMAVLLGACAAPDGDQPARSGGEPLQVVAGFYPLAEAVRQVGGPEVQVTNLTPAGAEAHDLELTPSQVDLVLDADLVVVLGGGFQPALEAAVEGRDGPTLRVGIGTHPEGEEEADAHAAEEDPDAGHDHASAGENDPHVWLDPREFAEMAEQIGESLAGLSGEAASIRARAESYAARLRDLDIQFELGLKRCERREIVTTHAAFGHLAAAYKLQQEAIAGLDPGSEPDPARLADLADHLASTGATTVFVEPLAPAGAAEVLARETGVATEQLDPLESLTAEGAEAGADYESVMLANLAALRKGLGCQ